jgi:hypothetical protein
VEGSAVEAAFDAGLVTSVAGGLLLGAIDRAIGMISRFAACFQNETLWMAKNNGRRKRIFNTTSDAVAN